MNQKVGKRAFEMLFGYVTMCVSKGGGGGLWMWIGCPCPPFRDKYCDHASLVTVCISQTLFMGNKIFMPCYLMRPDIKEIYI